MGSSQLTGASRPWRRCETALAETMRVRWWGGGGRQQRCELAQPSIGLSWNDVSADCAEFEVGPAAAALRCANLPERAVARPCLRSTSGAAGLGGHPR